MNFPILYSKNSTGLENDALGTLNECLKCEVTEERNGKYELEMQYPIEGSLYAEIKNRCLIKCKANQKDGMQIFRIYEISKPISGIVTIKAAHISYDLVGYYAPAIEAESITSAISQLGNQSKPKPFPFSFWTDKNSTGHFESGINSVRSCFGGRQGSILDVYGGEFEFDNYEVKIYNQRGKDRGVTIAYGRNLTDLKQDENVSNLYSGVLPYWQNDNGYTGQGGDPVYVEPRLGFDKIYTLDLSAEFDEMPTDEQMKAAAEKYIKENNIGKPDLNLKVSFAQLDQTEEYKGQNLLEKVYLCDTVHVTHKDLGINATAKATKVVFDVLADRVKSIQLGSIATKLTDTIAQNSQKIEKIDSPTYLQQAVDNATKWITSGKGYMVALKDSSGKWTEMLSLDTGDIDTAQSVWRWNNGGFGHSSSGWRGPYELALTADGKINADMITTGTLNANIIKAGTISSNDGNMLINLDDSTIVNGVRTGNQTVIKQGKIELWWDGIKKGTIATSKNNRIGIYSDETGNGAYIEKYLDVGKGIATGRALGGPTNYFTAIEHFRKNKFASTADAYVSSVKFGCGVQDSTPAITLEQHVDAGDVVYGRVDIYQRLLNQKTVNGHLAAIVPWNLDIAFSFNRQNGRYTQKIRIDSDGFDFLRTNVLGNDFYLVETRDADGTALTWSSLRTFMQSTESEIANLNERLNALG